MPTTGNPMIPQELARNFAQQADEAEAAGNHPLAERLRRQAADAWDAAQPPAYAAETPYGASGTGEAA